MSHLLSDVARVLDTAFPLHLVVRRDGAVVRTGALAGRVLGASRGQALLDVVDLVRPRARALDARELEGRAVIARSRRVPDLQLRGQVIAVGPGLWALACSPVVADLEALERVGIAPHDLPPHDATADLMVAAWSREEMNGQLNQAIGELQQTQEQLEARNAELEAARTDLAARNAELEEALATRSKAEAALRQTQKMDVLGKLVGGITHDFNNLLVAILGHATHGLEESQDPVARESLQGVYDAAERAAALTARLLTFSSPSAGTEGPVDVSREVRQVAGLLRRLLQDQVQLEVAVQVQPAWIPLDRSELEQILVNLAVNARDAMPDGGSLSVTIDHQRLDPSRAVALGVRPGPMVRLVVRDTGSGMTPEVVERVFEPFYSTKGPGRGTGLGLSTVFGLVRGADGTIQIDSAPGRGTTFTLWFPEADAPRSLHSGRHALGRVPVSEGNVVLLVDDEPQIRRVVGRMLTKDGWQVRQATSAENALERLPAVHDLALVITDQNMSGRTGVELVDALRTRGVTAPCIIMSGYSDDPRLWEGVRDGRFRLLPKPFSADKLSRAVDRTIARSRLRRLGESEIEPPTMPSWIGPT